MRKLGKAILAALVLCLLVAIILTAISSHDDGPRHQGHSLSYWLLRTNSESEAALYAVGTNALPYLLTWIRYEPKPLQFKSRIRGLLMALPPGLRSEALVKWTYWDRQQQIAEAAAQAFAVLGPLARPAIPDLVRLMNDATPTHASRRAPYALAGIGKDGLPFLIAQIANTNAQYRFLAILAIQRTPSLRTNSEPALPVLIQSLHDPDFAVKSTATNALRHIAPETFTNAPPQ